MARKHAPKNMKSRHAGDGEGTVWKCTKCIRSFSRINQRHACGTGDRSEVLRNRPEIVVRLFTLVEELVHSLGPVEIVARERYVLFRSRRIFTDLVIMTDAVRIAVHLRRRVDHPIFFKVVSDDRKVTHVAKLLAEKDVKAITRYVKAAYDFSLEY